MTGTDAVSAIFVPYGQGRPRGLDQDELGNHGADIDRLVALGLPVVPGLTVPVTHAASLGEIEVARVAVDLLQQLVGRHIGDLTHPVLIRVPARPRRRACLDGAAPWPRPPRPAGSWARP